jgi:hypothetical protein
VPDRVLHQIEGQGLAILTEGPTLGQVWHNIGDRGMSLSQKVFSYNTSTNAYRVNSGMRIEYGIATWGDHFDFT